jgi:hypothetical protein
VRSVGVAQETEDSADAKSAVTAEGETEEEESFVEDAEAAAMDKEEKEAVGGFGGGV